MNHFNHKLKDLSEEMRFVANKLIKYTSPKCHPKIEKDLIFIKTRVVIVDGYELVLFFSISQYDKRKHETLHIMSNDFNFLPFNLVSRVGRTFLGNKNLHLVELIKNGKKLYIWNVWLDENQNPTEVRVLQMNKTLTFEGWEYKYIYPD